MTMELVVLIVGLCSSVSGIIFAFLAFRRNDRSDNKNAGKDEGTLIADVSHIKQSVDRMEQDVNQLDERHHVFAERLAKVEEGLSNIQKRIEELHGK